MSTLARKLMAADSGPQVWEYVGISSAAISASGDITLTEPSGVQQGDLLVAVMCYRSNSTDIPTSPGAPWELIVRDNTGNNTANATSSKAAGAMFWCVRGASAPGLTFTRPSGDVIIGRIVAYRGVDQSNGFVTYTAPGAVSSGTTAVSVAGLTTQNDNDLIVFALCGARNNTVTSFNANTDPSTSSGSNSNQTADPIAGTWQERADSGTTTGADAALAIADAIRSTAGATGNLTCTASLGARHYVIAAAFKLG